MTFNNLCNSCTNIGCDFQSGIVRTNCIFYIPPHIEPDNCGNYVVMQPTAESEESEDGELHNGEWIPVDKKLPKEDGWYECTCVCNNLAFVMDLYFYANQKRWKDNRRIDMFRTYEIYGYGNKREKHLLSKEEIDELDWTDIVIAWMPLPEIYKPESEE